MKFFFRLALASTLAASGFMAQAEGYADKPITLIVPQATGGTNDIVARILGPRIGEAFTTNVLVENRPGAGGNIGTQAAARSVKDGHTLLMTISSSHAINPALYKTPGFDPVQDFAPIALVGTVPQVLVVGRQFPAKSLGEFFKLVKAAKPGTYQYASAGNGTLNHLLGEMLNTATGFEIQHIPYRGIAPALSDVIGGHVPIAFASLPSVLEHLRTGRLTALGVSSERRAPALPNIPAIAESLPGFAGSLWIGMFAPRGVPSDVELTLRSAMAKVLADSQTRAALAAHGVEMAGPTTPQQFGLLLREDIARWDRIVKTSHASID